MSSRRKRYYSDFVDSLPGNLAIVRGESTLRPIIEVIYIRQIQQIRSSFLFEHGIERYLKSKHEIELKADATSYYLQDNNNIAKTKEESLLFNIAQTEVLEVTKESLAALLIDDNKLIRRAARDWYEERSPKLG